MADKRYTPVGNHIWLWFLNRWKALAQDAEVKLLWLFFYTSSEAKTSVPGLWPGSVYTMELSGLSPNAAHNALDRMITHGMAQYDPENRLVRLTELPDTLDRAHTEQAIHGWYTRFKTLPECPLRDAHVPTLWGLVSGGKVNVKMEDAWKVTFGTIVTPAHLPSFLPLSSSDTSTPTQGSLFSAPSFRPPTPSSASNEINYSGPRGVPTDQGRDQGLDSGSPDLSVAATETAIRPRPALALVLPFTPETLLAEIATGMGTSQRQTVRETLREALGATITALDKRGWGLDEVRLAGRWIASSHGRGVLEAIRLGSARGPGGYNAPPDEVLCVWAASPADVIATIESARQHEREAAERSAFLASLTGSGSA